MISRSRRFGSWTGDRNRYSKDIIDIVQALYNRGVATPSTPIWIGNTAGNRGEHLGTVRSIIEKQDFLSRITLYHGIDNFRLEQIMKTGLKALELKDRVWNSSREKVRPAHREEAVYLTASRPQAEYYAKKAMNIDRKRFGPSKRYDLRHKLSAAKDSITRMQRELLSFDKMNDAEIANWDEHAQKYDRRGMLVKDKRSLYPDWIAKAQALVDQMQIFNNDNFYGKIEPVIIQVTIYKNDFDKLMADDDYLAQNPKAKPEDWQESLSHFGQVAFKGIISPERIKVIAQGNEAGQISN